MSKVIKIDYKPTPKQRMFHTSIANEILYGGAAGGGKTKAIVMDALMRTASHPNTTAYIFRRHYSELENSDIAEARSSYPPELGTYNNGRHCFELNNGSKIYFRHCSQESDLVKYLGVEMQFLYFDELTTFTERMYDFICSRLRAKKALGVQPIVRSASNPGSVGHGWVKARFVDIGEFGVMHKKKIHSEALRKDKYVTFQYIPSLATDNPFITQDYIFELEKKPEALRNAMLYGQWDAFEGQVFVEWRNDPKHYIDRRLTHVIDPFEIPPNWKRYFSFDYGYSKPFACLWWAVSPDGTAYLYREWYGWNGHADTGLQLTPRQIAEGIVDREKEERKENLSIIRVADPSIFDESRGNSVAHQMEPYNSMTNTRDKGVFFEPGDNERLAGLAQMHERLRFNADGRPYMQVFSTCTQFIRTVPNLPYSPTNVEDVDTKSEDHGFDAARYFFMMCPIGTVIKTRKKHKPFDPFEFDTEG